MSKRIIKMYLIFEVVLFISLNLTAQSNYAYKNPENSVKRRVKYPVLTKSDSDNEPSTRLSNYFMPVQACWFWGEEEFNPGGYKTFIDQASIHSPYNLLSASVRLFGREVTSDAVHNQIKLAAEYANEHGIGLIADLDVRAARRAFESKYPDELQEMLLLKEVQLSGNLETKSAIKSKDLSDHYTGGTTHYIPLYGKLLRVYSYIRTNEGIEKNTIKDITRNCVVMVSSKDSIEVKIPAYETNPSSEACVMVSFTHLTPDVFAPHLMEFQRDILRQYADVPLSGAFKDEWGFPICVDGSPAKDQFWYSKFRAQAYSEKTGGRDLLADCLLMHLGVKGMEQERQMVINYFMEMSLKRNSDIENDYYNAVKEVFGPDAAVTTHPTWYPYPDLREQMKNGLDWWTAKRDWAQTDEVTPFAVRTALAKKWGSPIWYNMYYSTNRTDYERSVWSYALAGGRINYHPLYPSGLKGNDKRLELLRGDLMIAESRVRLLNYISKTPLDCPVAVIFGHTCTMNWAGPAYDDVGMELINKLWCSGIATDLIPSSEIGNGNIVVDQDGWIRYGSQRYAAVVLFHPEFERNTTADFFVKAATGKTRMFRIGDWTRDFNGNNIKGNEMLPRSMTVSTEIDQVLSAIKNILKKQRIDLQSPAIMSTVESFSHLKVDPPTTGYSRLIDGTFIYVAGTENVSGDPFHVNKEISGHKVSADATGLLAFRFDTNGRLNALVAGGLKSFKITGFKIELTERTDIALWVNDKGEWEGVIQGLKGAVPGQLLNITKNWSRLDMPVAISE